MKAMQVDLLFQSQLPFWLRLSVAYYPIGYTIDLSDRAMRYEYNHGLRWATDNPQLATAKTVSQWLSQYADSKPTPRTLAFARGAVKLHYWAES